MFRLLITLLAIAFAPSAFGYPFDVQPTDISLKGLGAVFGSSVGAVFLGGAPNPLISDMFELFNGILLSVGGIFVGYLTLMSVISTAQEGEILGKTWSSVYIPLRSILGLLLLIPAPGSGFAMIQVTAMYLIVQGIGAANLIWNVVMDNLASGASATDVQKPNSSKLRSDAAALTRNVLDAAVCIETLKYLSGSPSGTLPADFPTYPSNFISSGNGGKLRPWLVNAGQSSGSTPDDSTFYGFINYGIKNDATFGNFCGAHKIVANVKRSEWPTSMQGAANVESEARGVFEKKVSALLTMYTNIQPIAKRIVANKVEPRDLNNRLADAPPIPGSYVPIVKDMYPNIMAGAIVPQEADSERAQVVEQGKLYGWASAGSFYFLLSASESQRLFKTVDTQPPQVSPTPDLRGSIPTAASGESFNTVQSYLTPDELTFLKNRLRDAENYFENDTMAGGGSLSISMPDSASSGGHKFIKELMKPLTELTAEIVDGLMSEMTEGGGGDPLLSLAQFGNDLMRSAEIVWFVIIGISIVLAVAAGICSAASPAFVTLLTVFVTLISVIFVVFIMLWSIGATLAVYLPLIPYMFFFIALVGWFFQVIEAIVAMPLVGLAVITPTGDEVGRITPALMLLMSTILRPSLMIMGFILAAILLRAMISYINFTFIAAWEGGPSTGSLFMPIVLIALYGGFIIAITNNVFKLIYIVPDRIMRWIEGGTAAVGQTKGQEIVKEAERGAEAGTAIGKGILTGGSEALTEAKNRLKQVKEKGKQRKKDKKLKNQKAEIEDQMDTMDDSSQLQSQDSTNSTSSTDTGSGGDGGGGDGGGGDVGGGGGGG